MQVEFTYVDNVYYLNCIDLNCILISPDSLHASCKELYKTGVCTENIIVMRVTCDFLDITLTHLGCYVFLIS